MAKLRLVQAVNQALQQAMENPNVYVLGEDVGVDGGIFRATDGLIERYGSHRVIDTPLSERGIVAVSLGLALGGLLPIAEIQEDGFMYSGFDQITSHVARYHKRTGGAYKASLVIRVPYGGGIRAMEHHSEAPETYFAHTPGLKIVIPSTPYAAKGLLLAAIHDPDPVIFFEPKKIYRSLKQDVPEYPYTLPLGKAHIMRQGHDVTVVTWGAMTHTCLEAAEQSSVGVEVIDVRTLSPLDIETILTSVEKTGRLCIVHEAPQFAGLGAEIAAQVSEKGILSLKAPIQRVTGYTVPTASPKLEHWYLPTVERIQKSIETVMSFHEYVPTRKRTGLHALPSVRHTAYKKRLSLSQVKGSGPAGRIMDHDIQESMDLHEIVRREIKKQLARSGLVPHITHQLPLKNKNLKKGVQLNNTSRRSSMAVRKTTKKRATKKTVKRASRRTAKATKKRATRKTAKRSRTAARRTTRKKATRKTAKRSRTAARRTTRKKATARKTLKRTARRAVGTTRRSSRKGLLARIRRKR